MTLHAAHPYHCHAHRPMPHNPSLVALLVLRIYAGLAAGFEKAPRDTAQELPPKYKAPSFMCSALQQSKPQLSWDADDSERSKMMKRDFSKAEIKEMEYSQCAQSPDARVGKACVLHSVLRQQPLVPSHRRWRASLANCAPSYESLLL